MEQQLRTVAKQFRERRDGNEDDVQEIFSKVWPTYIYHGNWKQALMVKYPRGDASYLLSCFIIDDGTNIFRVGLPGNYWNTKTPTYANALPIEAKSGGVCP